MANIHNLIIKYDSTSPREGSFPIDLNCGTPEVNKTITAGIYDMDFTPPKKVLNFTGSNNKVLTRIEDCDGSYILVEESFGYVNSLVVSLCEVCVDSAGGNVIGNDCDKPMHTRDCDRTALIAMLQNQYNELVKIFGAVDGLEITADQINLNAEQINLSTDELEQLLTDLNALVTLKGSNCANALFIKDCGTQDVLDKLQEVIDAINSSSADEQDILTEISTKLDDLALIKGELVTANSTLSGIKTDTAGINTNLTTVISRLDTQIVKLDELKVLVSNGNDKIDLVNTTLSTISADIATIKTDISAIKADVSAIKASTASIDTKLSTVVTSLASIETKLDTIHSDLTTINTTLQTEFDQTQGKLEELITSVKFAQDTFQAKDCEGNNIGGVQEVLKVVQLNKQISSVCNTSDISDPIVAAIEDNAPQITNGKRHSLVAYTAFSGDVLTINPVFSTISMLVCKGEFQVENTSNDFRSDLTKTDGTWVKYIELSADGVGTVSGAKDLPQSLDTRANSKDLEPLLNSYSVTCIRDGVVQLELYKD